MHPATTSLFALLSGPTSGQTSTVTLYATVPDAAIVDMEQLQDAFGLQGEARRRTELGGFEHLVDKGTHARVFANGGAEVHVLDRMSSEDPITPVPPVTLWRRTAHLNTSLGLRDLGPVALEPVGIGNAQVELIHPDGTREGPWLTHQAVSLTQVIDGLPGFGGGAQVEVVYQGRDVVAFSHGVRELESLGSVSVIAPEEALRRFDERLENGRWNLHKTAWDEVLEIDITSATLGYLVPDVGSEVLVLEPVYEVRGTVVGVNPDGVLDTSELVWIEPGHLLTSRLHSLFERLHDLPQNLGSSMLPFNKYFRMIGSI